jgi:hypothetical protein
VVCVYVRALVCTAQPKSEPLPTKSVTMSFDDWLGIADSVEERIYNNQTVTDLYYMKMVGAGGNGNDVRLLTVSQLCV